MITTTPTPTPTALGIPAPPFGSSPSMPIRRVLGSYRSEIKHELLRTVRTPGFSIPFLLLPAPIYLLFGVVIAAPAIADKPSVANYLFSSWLVYAAMGPAMFGVGCALATEREAGLLKLKRALPAPAGAYLLAKAATAMAIGAVAVMSIVVAAVLLGPITLSAGQLLTMAAVMIAGTVPFSALGLFIGARASGSAAPAVINLVFLPMLWLGGLFFPLPKFLEPWVVIWPAFHLNQVAIGAAGIHEYQFVPPAISAGVLVGLTVLFGGLAIHRLARKG